MHVRILADADDKGRRHAASVYEMISGVAASCKIFVCMHAKDITEQIENGGTLRDGLKNVTIECLDLIATKKAAQGKPAVKASTAADIAAQWALDQLWLDPPEGSVHNGRADIAYRFAQQLRDVDRTVAEEAMRIYWTACPQVTSDGELEPYQWSSAADTLNSALDSVPSDWEPGVFARALDANGWPELIDAASIEEMEVHWLWKNRIPFGKVTIIEGDPDVGKSLVTLDIVAWFTSGVLMPDNSPVEGERRLAILTSVEDDFADTIVPR